MQTYPIPSHSQLVPSHLIPSHHTVPCHLIISSFPCHLAQHLPPFPRTHQHAPPRSPPLKCAAPAYEIARTPDSQAARVRRPLDRHALQVAAPPHHTRPRRLEEGGVGIRLLRRGWGGSWREARIARLPVWAVDERAGGTGPLLRAPRGGERGDGGHPFDAAGGRDGTCEGGEAARRRRWSVRRMHVVWGVLDAWTYGGVVSELLSCGVVWLGSVGVWYRAV